MIFNIGSLVSFEDEEFIIIGQQTADDNGEKKIFLRLKKRAGEDIINVDSSKVKLIDDKTINHDETIYIQSLIRNMNKKDNLSAPAKKMTENFDLGAQKINIAPRRLRNENTESFTNINYNEINKENDYVKKPTIDYDFEEEIKIDNASPNKSYSTFKIDKINLINNGSDDIKETVSSEKLSFPTKTLSSEDLTAYVKGEKNIDNNTNEFSKKYKPKSYDKTLLKNSSLYKRFKLNTIWFIVIASLFVASPFLGILFKVIANISSNTNLNPFNLVFQSHGFHGGIAFLNMLGLILIYVFTPIFFLTFVIYFVIYVINFFNLEIRKDTFFNNKIVKNAKKIKMIEDFNNESSVFLIKLHGENKDIKRQIKKILKIQGINVANNLTAKENKDLDN